MRKLSAILSDKIEKLPEIDEIIKQKKKDTVFARSFERETIRIQIAREVRRIREKAKMTQSDLATAINVKQPVIGRLESMKDQRIPGVDMLARISAATNTTFVLRDVRSRYRMTIGRAGKETKGHRTTGKRTLSVAANARSPKGSTSKVKAKR